MKFPIPSDWDGESWCEWAVCWPDSELWRGFLRGLLTLPQRGWTWDERTGIVTDVQQIGREITRLNIDLRGVLVACNDPGLQEIALALHALAARQCCEQVGARQGSGGAGSVEPPLDDTVLGNPDVDPPPDGFESWEEFFSDKCAVAHDIVSELQASLLKMGIINFGAISLEGLGIALTIVITLTVPASIIVAIAALLISVGGEIVVATLLSIINDNSDDLVCHLFEGENAGDSLGLFHDALGVYVDNGVADAVEGYAIKTLAGYLVNNQVVNRLYQKDLTKVWPLSDCSGCGPGWEFYPLASGGHAGVLDSGDMSSDTGLFVVSSVLEISGDPCEGDNVVSLHTPVEGRIVSISVVEGSLTASECGIDWAWTRASDNLQFTFSEGAFNFNAIIGSEPLLDFFVRSSSPFALEFVVTLD